jgi:hypothetical protein
MESLQDKIASRIHKKGSGRVLMPIDFLDLGNRDAVDQALGRLTKKGSLHRVARGLYYVPVYSKLLKTVLSPSIDEIVAAIAKREKRKIQVTGAVAANALGLSEQVPAKIAYLTDGRSKKVKIGNATIEFRHATPKSMIEAGTKVGLVIQALKHLGKDHIEETVIERLKSLLTVEEKRKLLSVSKDLSYWMKGVIAAVAAKGAPWPK